MRYLLAVSKLNSRTTCKYSKLIVMIKPATESGKKKSMHTIYPRR